MYLYIHTYIHTYIYIYIHTYIGRDIVSEGPMTRADLDEVIRDAIVRGGGDVWKVPDFLVAYTEKNARKRMYKRIEAPLDGFLKIVPNTGCYFHNYKYYNGVEFGRDYTFGHNNKLTQYEDEVSTALNRILRHQVGTASEKQSLVCDDAGWVPIDDVLRCEGIWRCERSRRPHTFLLVPVVLVVCLPIAYIYIYIYIHTYILTYILTYLHTYIHTYIIHIFYIYIYTHTYIYIYFIGWLT